MSEELYYYDAAPGAAEREFRELGHRIVYHANGWSANIYGIYCPQLISVDDYQGTLTGAVEHD